LEKRAHSPRRGRREEIRFAEKNIRAPLQSLWKKTFVKTNKTAEGKIVEGTWLLTPKTLEGGKRRGLVAELIPLFLPSIKGGRPLSNEEK